jgi:hypothetical protein
LGETAPADAPRGTPGSASAAAALRRTTGITNAAAAGMAPFSIMRMAGHSDFKTTQRYIDLAGVVFGDEVRRLSEWYVETGTKSRYEVAADEAETRMESGIEALSD